MLNKPVNQIAKTDRLNEPTNERKDEKERRNTHNINIMFNKKKLKNKHDKNILSTLLNQS